MEDQLAQARSILSITPQRWLSLAETVPLELLTRAPWVGEWSAAECLLHLLDTERKVFPMRVRAFLAGQNFPAFDPETQGTRATDASPAEMAGELARLRDESLRLLVQVREEDLSRTAEHPELGTVTLGEQILEWAAHDLTHTIQAERALMQPFIAGSGPWRSAFADHDVSPEA